MNIYRFIVDYFDDEELKVKTCKGFVAADGFGNAMKRIAEYIGEKNITDVKSLFCFDDICEDADFTDLFEKGE